MKDLIIIGAGGHGKVCADIAQRMNKFKSIKFFDENKTGKVMDIEIVQSKNIGDLINQNTEIFVAIGDNHVRSEKIEFILKLGATLATLIDPSAIISRTTIINEGTVIMPNVVVNTGVHVGKGVILNSSSVVEHDCQIHDYVHIAPGTVLTGTVNVGQNSFIGANSTVLPNLTIHSNVIIGANTIVIENINQAGTYIRSLNNLKEL